MNRTNDAKSRPFEDAVRAHQGLVFSVAFGILLDREETLEVVQETFLKAFQEERFLAPDFNRAGWLVRTARNLALNLRRSLTRGVQRWFRWALPGTATPVQDHEDALIRDEDLKLLEELLKELDDEDRLLLTLRYAASYSYQQIADDMGLKIGTVMSRLSRLKEKLGAAMTDPPEVLP